MQMAAGLEQLVILTRVTFRCWDGGNYRTSSREEDLCAEAGPATASWSGRLVVAGQLVLALMSGLTHGVGARAVLLHRAHPAVGYGDPGRCGECFGLVSVAMGGG
jgi:hypothetical protein